MTRIILAAAVVAFTIVLVAGTDIEAKGTPHISANVTRSSTTLRVNNFNANVRGNNFNANIRGSNFRGWNSYCWFGQYRCYGCYCPTAQCWYYWYAPMQCYLPISYMSIYPPTPFGAPGFANPGFGAPGFGAPGLGAPGLGAPGLGAPGLAPVGPGGVNPINGTPALPPGGAAVNVPPTPVSPGDPLPMVP